MEVVANVVEVIKNELLIQLLIIFGNIVLLVFVLSNRKVVLIDVLEVANDLLFIYQEVVNNKVHKDFMDQSYKMKGVTLIYVIIAIIKVLEEEISLDWEMNYIAIII